MTGAYVAVRDSAIHGRGVFARQPIPRGTRVAEYTGARVPVAGVARDIVAGLTSGSYLLRLDETTVIDGERGGNEARFINHGCAPNCEIVYFHDVPYVYAMTGIPEGDELLFDYQLGASDGTVVSPADGRSWFPCHCGSPECRGTMLKI